MTEWKVENARGMTLFTASSYEVANAWVQKDRGGLNTYYAIKEVKTFLVAVLRDTGDDVIERFIRVKASSKEEAITQTRAEGWEVLQVREE